MDSYSSRIRFGIDGFVANTQSLLDPFHNHVRIGFVGARNPSGWHLTRAEFIQDFQPGIFMLFYGSLSLKLFKIQIRLFHVSAVAHETVAGEKWLNGLFEINRA